jgi:hypothetical protein
VVAFIDVRDGDDVETAGAHEGVDVRGGLAGDADGGVGEAFGGWVSPDASREDERSGREGGDAFESAATVHHVLTQNERARVKLSSDGGVITVRWL